jgi:oxygen-independent coproporphyrinogen-3 oxidase
MMVAIEKELVLRKNELKNEKVETIYLGGGTPSILTTNEITLLLKKVYENFNVIQNPEITLEANPDDLIEEKIVGLSKTQINRLSIGIQSFFDEDLQFMNRAHTAYESKKCLETTLKYFDNITIDLIYGVPNMTNEKWSKNLEIAFDFEIPHISSYALTVEEKTALHSFIKKGKIKPLEDKLASEHFDILINSTRKQGFVQYEISNFGKPDYFSKHNTAYWLGKKYLGIGPSAHSFDGNNRAWNVSNNAKYIKAITKDILPLEVEHLSKKDRFNELIMIGLRTIWGVDLLIVKKIFGLNYYNHLLKSSKPLIKNEQLKINNNKTLLVTEKGSFFSDGIASELFVV